MTTAVMLGHGKLSSTVVHEMYKAQSLVCAEEQDLKLNLVSGSAWAFHSKQRWADVSLSFQFLEKVGKQEVFLEPTESFFTTFL